MALDKHTFRSHVGTYALARTLADIPKTEPGAPRVGRQPHIMPDMSGQDVAFLRLFRMGE